MVVRGLLDDIGGALVNEPMLLAETLAVVVRYVQAASMDRMQPASDGDLLSRSRLMLYPT